ncbi:MAG: hypothetical protein A3I91_01380 [Candidatus Kerfeldbacteria bacterium RIFCSPLOWO2_02_FULL_42_19]|nr:MAG: hypothetical protein A3E60_00355 [Candidatus Kerfeldbacteria bacterium RIFCSPHIGHO2_12_FULL_42_13]OGY84125.1 MAG: hypothetical protein A3I91_01380 [Candidatus Kerfeldbacteria bacterium RIFCSPLOWO2_02_FULL_42_19]OGY87255.1 MAG: hypothetical protein A3G01_02850 [Candidatus Kerfeldbacteria bacterium RIFCSPLOWO2_12_FULL_43_9]
MICVNFEWNLLHPIHATHTSHRNNREYNKKVNNAPDILEMSTTYLMCDLYMHGNKDSNETHSCQNAQKIVLIHEYPLIIEPLSLFPWITK